MEGARPARAEDVTACARLLSDARHAAESRRGGPSLLADRGQESPPVVVGATADAALRSWMASAGHLLWCGTLDDSVVGVAAGHVRSLSDERVGVVDCLYVEPAARGVGVGSALAAALVAAYTELGCVAVDAPALPGDRETKQRFEAAGFSARLLVLHRRLP